MNEPQNYPIIGAKEHFYGYIIGVHVEPMIGEEVPKRLLATFEDRYKLETWEVPDVELFRILSKHLCDTASMRSEHGDYGYAKLIIKYQDGRWDVDLP